MGFAPDIFLGTRHDQPVILSGMQWSEESFRLLDLYPASSGGMLPPPKRGGVSMTLWKDIRGKN
jgi:hypothetical protein